MKKVSRFLVAGALVATMSAVSTPAHAVNEYPTPMVARTTQKLATVGLVKPTSIRAEVSVCAFFHFWCGR